MTRRYVLVCAIALLASSTGAMAWAGKGSWEPSTKLDRDDGYMWPAGNPTTARKVYFNGFLTDSEVAVQSTSPNLGLIRSSFQTRDAHPFAMVGVWRDCNRDDFIGNMDANYVYPVTTPGVDLTLCPQTPGVYPTHNDGRWIYEFTPITYSNRSILACCDANTYVDNLAKVWADYGLPDRVLGSECPVSPAPRGTFRSTGGLLAWADCNSEYAVTHQVNTLAEGLGRDDLSFGDQPDGYSGDSASALNRRIDPQGYRTDEAYVEAFDCSDPDATFNVQDDNPTPIHENPTPFEREQIPGVVTFNVTGIWNLLVDWTVNPNVKQPTMNSGGSFWGTYNKTGASANDCERSHADLIATVSDSPGEGGPRAEFTGRIRPDAPLTSAQWPHRYDRGASPQETVDDVLDKHLSLIGSDFRQFWYGQASVANTGPLTRSGTFQGAQYWTYYGSLSADAISRFGFQLAGVTGSYGAEACAATAADGLTRFDCDRTNWWKRSDGTEVTARDAGSAACFDFESKCDPRAFVGDSYNMRDVDCVDYAIGATREEGLTVPHLAGQPCF